MTSHGDERACAEQGLRLAPGARTAWAPLTWHLQAWDRSKVGRRPWRLAEKQEVCLPHSPRGKLAPRISPAGLWGALLGPHPEPGQGRTLFTGEGGVQTRPVAPSSGPRSKGNPQPHPYLQVSVLVQAPGGPSRPHGERPRLSGPQCLRQGPQQPPGALPSRPQPWCRFHLWNHWLGLPELCSSCPRAHGQPGTHARRGQRGASEKTQSLREVPISLHRPHRGPGEAGSSSCRDAKAHWVPVSRGHLCTHAAELGTGPRPLESPVQPAQPTRSGSPGPRAPPRPAGQGGWNTRHPAPALSVSLNSSDT